MAPFYAVQLGHNPGVYTTWDECQTQVKNFPRPRFKKFATAAEAQEYVDRGTTTRACPSRSEGVYDVVFCDGACRGNGMTGAVAGIGVWWGKDDPRNLSERCPGVQTNNRAELIAIARVLETAHWTNKTLLIKTDSQYCISCFQEWITNWQRNNWMNAKGERIKNYEIIRYISACLRARELNGQKVLFEHVKGHSGDVGNEAADALATQGAGRPPLEEREWGELRHALEVRYSLAAHPKPTLEKGGTPPRANIPPLSSKVEETPENQSVRGKTPMAATSPAAARGHTSGQRLGMPSSPSPVSTHSRKEDFMSGDKTVPDKSAIMLSPLTRGQTSEKPKPLLWSPTFRRPPREEDTPGMDKTLSSTKAPGGITTSATPTLIPPTVAAATVSSPRPARASPPPPPPAHVHTDSPLVSKAPRGTKRSYEMDFGPGMTVEEVRPSGSKVVVRVIDAGGKGAVPVKMTVVEHQPLSLSLPPPPPPPPLPLPLPPSPAKTTAVNPDEVDLSIFQDDILDDDQLENYLKEDDL